MNNEITPHDDAHDGFRVHIDPDHQEPLPAVVVADVRDTLGKRLAVAGVVGLLLFFVIAAYKQAVKNGDKKIPAPIVTVKPPSPSTTPVPVVTVVPGPGRVIVVPSVAPGTSPAPPRASAPPQISPAPRGSRRPSPKPSPAPSPSPIVQVCVRNLPCIHPGSLR